MNLKRGEKMLIILPEERKHSFTPVIVSETTTAIHLSDEYYPPPFLPRVLVKEGEKWIKHVHMEGIRQHVLSWHGTIEMYRKKKSCRRCSEPDCIINKS